MRILVTGGAGYIGSHTVRALLDKGHEVVVVDRRSAPPGEALQGARFIAGDIADTSLLQRALMDHAIEGVIHFAAFKSVAESMGHPERYFRNNVAGSLSILEAMVAAGTPAIVFSSSCSVYGTPERLPVDEDAALRPDSPYGSSKVMVEEMLLWMEAAHGIRYLSLRYFNASGASLDGSLGEDGASSTMLIPRLLEAVRGKRGPVDIYGTDYATPDGTAIRDYIHVLDLADAHVRALDLVASGDARPRILNLGTGHGTSVREVIVMTAKVTDRNVPVRYVARRPGDPPAVWADSRRAMSALSWRPRHDLEVIIRSAWNWHSVQD